MCRPEVVVTLAAALQPRNVSFFRSLVTDPKQLARRVSRSAARKTANTSKHFDQYYMLVVSVFSCCLW